MLGGRSFWAGQDVLRPYYYAGFSVEAVSQGVERRHCYIASLTVVVVVVMLLLWLLLAAGVGVV